MPTLVREYTTDTGRDAEIARYAVHGWAVQSLTHARGHYRAGRGFALAVVATPVAALLAGNTPDRWAVVFAAPDGTPEPPPPPVAFVSPPRTIPADEQRAAWLWALRWGAALLALCLLAVAVVVALLPH
jgi:hypothetical protein